MNSSSQAQKTQTLEPAQPPSPKEIPKETPAPSDTLLEVIRRTPLSSEEFDKVIGELYAGLEQRIIDTYLQGSRALGCLKGSDAIQTTSGLYGIQSRQPNPRLMEL